MCFVSLFDPNCLASPPEQHPFDFFFKMRNQLKHELKLDVEASACTLNGLLAIWISLFFFL